MKNFKTGSAKLPKPFEENYRWQEEALCRGLDVELFFLPDNCRERAKYERIEKAKSICSACPVLAACRDFAIKSEQPYGVWGGLSEEERQTIIRRIKKQKYLASKLA